MQVVLLEAHLISLPLASCPHNHTRIKADRLSSLCTAMNVVLRDSPLSHCLMVMGSLWFTEICRLCTYCDLLVRIWVILIHDIIGLRAAFRGIQEVCCLRCQHAFCERILGAEGTK